MRTFHSEQDTTMSTWLIMNGCLLQMPERATNDYKRVRRDQVDIALSISVLCVEITKPEPIVSLSRVLHLRIVQKDVNIRT